MPTISKDHAVTCLRCLWIFNGIFNTNFPLSESENISKIGQQLEKQKASSDCTVATFWLKVRGATTFSKLGVQFLGLRYYTKQNTTVYPVSCTAVCCYVKKNLGWWSVQILGVRTPSTPSGCALAQSDRWAGFFVPPYVIIYYRQANRPQSEKLWRYNPRRLFVLCLRLVYRPPSSSLRKRAKTTGSLRCIRSAEIP